MMHSFISGLFIYSSKICAFSFSFVISSLDAFLLLLGPDHGFDKFRSQVGFCVPSTLPYFLTVFSDGGHESSCNIDWLHHAADSEKFCSAISK